MLVLLAATACRRAPTPDVVVVVVDTLRADRLGCYGNTRGLTPFLDELAERGTVFRHAYAASSWTNPSVASLFTSRYPSQHQVTTYVSTLATSELTLAEALAPAGHVAAGFSANPGLQARFGYAQGYTRWAVNRRVAKLPARRLTRKATLWLDRQPKTSRPPVLLYLQYMEPHLPYEPPTPYREHNLDAAQRTMDAAAANQTLAEMRWPDIGPEQVRLLESLYDGEVALADERLHELFAELERRGVLENAIVVITADHGEEFKDHDMMGHGTSLYDELIHVPLLILQPGQSRGRVVEQDVSLVDVAPTLLELVGRPREPRFEGRSLVPLLQGKGGEADVFAELRPRSAGTFAIRHSRALVRGPAKLLMLRDFLAETPVAFDLAADPHEQKPNPPSLDAHKPALSTALAEWAAAIASRGAATAAPQPLDEQTRRNLRALGYIQ